MAARSRPRSPPSSTATSPRSAPSSPPACRASSDAAATRRRPRARRASRARASCRTSRRRDTEMIFQQLINGLMLGASYALIAIGYTLIFGVLRLLYFAHGEVFMVGAFIGLFSVVFAGFGISGALLGAMIGCAALGVVAYFVTVRPVPKDR